MQNTKERVFAVKERIKEIEVEKKIGKRRLIKISSLAASLLVILGLSLLMPGLEATIFDGQYDGHTISASIFDGSDFLGYIFIGLLAFILGISVTILSYHFKRRNQLDQDNLEDEND